MSAFDSFHTQAKQLQQDLIGQSEEQASLIIVQAFLRVAVESQRQVFEAWDRQIIKHKERLLGVPS